jgi:hypothetical protein
MKTTTKTPLILALEAEIAEIGTARAREVRNSLIEGRKPNFEALDEREADLTERLEAAADEIEGAPARAAAFERADTAAFERLLALREKQRTLVTALLAVQTEAKGAVNEARLASLDARGAFKAGSKFKAIVNVYTNESLLTILDRPALRDELERLRRDDEDLDRRTPREPLKTTKGKPLSAAEREKRKRLAEKNSEKQLRDEGGVVLFPA